MLNSFARAFHKTTRRLSRTTVDTTSTASSSWSSGAARPSLLCGSSRRSRTKRSFAHWVRKAAIGNPSLGRSATGHAKRRFGMPNKDEVQGRVKEAAGDLTDDKDLKREGKIDQATG